MGLGEAARARGLSSRFPQARKPLVEKKRRARINESLQELRLLLAGTEVRREGCGGLQVAPRSTQPDSTPFPSAQVQAKLENAEVLELTVRRVQGALRGRARGEWRRGSRAGALTGQACHSKAGHVGSRSPGPVHGEGSPPEQDTLMCLLGEPRPRGADRPSHGSHCSRCGTPLSSSHPPAQSGSSCRLKQASASLLATSSACMRCTRSCPRAKPSMLLSQLNS